MGILTAAGKRPYLDTNVFVYALEGYPDFAEQLRKLFRAIDQGRLEAVTSELCLAEVLVKPIASRKNELCQQYDSALQNSRGLSVLPITRSILMLAAEIRAKNSVRLPDAIHLATAQLAACDTFLTNDQRLHAYSGIKVVILSEAVTN